LKQLGAEQAHRQWLSQKTAVIPESPAGDIRDLDNPS